MSTMSNMSKLWANHLSYINVVNSSIAFVVYDSFNLIPNMTKATIVISFFQSNIDHPET